MRTRRRPTIELYGLALLLGAIGTACAEDAKPAYPVMAPIEQYLEASASGEIALARTAAPASISGDASVLVLSRHGYETAVTGKNGFVCLVWRSWAGPGGFDDNPDFWSPKIRAPACFNPAAARTVVPAYLDRTKWALAGASKAEIEDRTRAAVTSKRIATPEPGAMTFMMGGEGSDAAGHHWPPHVMIFVAHTDVADWGADLNGVPIIAFRGDPEPVTTFAVMVTLYSDGTPAPPGPHSH